MTKLHDPKSEFPGSDSLTSFQRFKQQLQIATFHWVTFLPGLGLSLLLAVISIVGSRALPTKLFSPLILAIFLGIIWRNSLGVRSSYLPGIRFALRRLLKLGIVLLGLQLSLTQLLAIGPNGLAIVSITLISTYAFTCWLGPKLGVTPRLTHLIAAGTSICGASAVVATQSVLRASDEDAAYATAVVTLWGTVTVFFYPLLAQGFDLSLQQFGFWCGASIHEIAQVVAAAFQNGTASGEVATIVKLARVIFLAPMLLSVNALQQRRAKQLLPQAQQQSIPYPWFVLFFLLLIGVNSTGLINSEVRVLAMQITQVCLAIALAAMGLEISWQKLNQVGWQPLYLGGGATLFIASLSVAMVTLWG